MNNEKTIDWLLAGPSYIRYRTLLDLLSLKEDDSEVNAARISMLEDDQILSLINDAIQWDNSVLKRHNDAAHPLHKLSFLVELGIKKNVKGMARIVDSILHHESTEGPFQVLTNIASAFGSSGLDEWQ